MSKGSDVKARKMEAEDIERVLEWRNHEDIKRWMINQSEVSLEEHLRWYARAQDDESRELVVVDSDSSPIGFVQFDLDSQHNRAEWGFYKAPRTAGGVGRKLGKAALEFAFLELGLNKVYGQVLYTNEISKNFHLSLGFEQEGSLREHVRIGTTFFDMVFFGLLRSQWAVASV